MVLPTQQLVVSMLWERHVLAATISQRNVLNQVLIANTKQHSPKNMGRFLASLFTAAAATPKVGGTRRPVPLSRSAARSHCRTVAPTGREVWQSKDTTTPWGTRLRILQAVVSPR